MNKEQKLGVIKTMRNTWDALDTHLDWVVDPVKDKKFRKIHGGARFHAKTVVEYCESLLALAKTL